MITILLLLLLRQLSGRKTRLALAAAAPPPQLPNPFPSFQTGMPIFRALLSAVMAVGSLASFNPSLPPASWLAEGMPLRSNPPNSWLRRPTFHSQMLRRKVGGGAWVAAKKKCSHPMGAATGGLRVTASDEGQKHKTMIMMMCGYFGDRFLVWTRVGRTLFSHLILFDMRRWVLKDGDVDRLAGDPLTFPLMPIWGQSFHLTYIKICWANARNLLSIFTVLCNVINTS